MTQPVPHWFTEALGTPFNEHSARVAGRDIVYRARGPADGTPVVLVHGATAHQGWWDHIAPLLAGQARVVTLDLSGHGNAAWRGAYSYDEWVDEVLAVGFSSAGTSPPILVGHSMGGLVCLLASQRAGAGLGAAVAIDSVVRDLPSDVREARRIRSSRSTRIYPTRELDLKTFHPLPPSTRALQYVLDHIAAHSVVEAPGGWTWKFDLRIFAQEPVGPAELGQAHCPVRLINADDGLVEAAMATNVSIRLETAPSRSHRRLRPPRDDRSSP